MHMFHSRNRFLNRVEDRIYNIYIKEMNDSSCRYLREISIHTHSLIWSIIAQTTAIVVTSTRQLNKEVCDKTRNTLVF